MPDLPRVSDLVLSWNSGRLVVGGVPMNGYGSFDCEHGRTRKIVYGQKRDGTPLGKTSGKYEPKPITISFLLDQYTKLLMPVLALQGIGSRGDASFTVMYQYMELLNPLLTTTFTFTGCTIDNEKHSGTEGPDEAKIDVTIGPLACIIDASPLSSVAGALGL